MARYQCEISVLEITRKRHFSQFNQPRPVIIDNVSLITNEKRSVKRHATKVENYIIIGIFVNVNT